jgi:hypothetical protein
MRLSILARLARGVPRRVAIAALATLCAACAGDGPSGPTTGSLALTLSGLPDGVGALAAVTGPNGYSRAVAASETLADLAPGDYVITSQPVALSTARYAPRVATQTVHVRAASGPATASVVYEVATGSLALRFGGDGASGGSATVTGPGGYSTRVSAGAATTLTSLEPGSYAIAAGPATDVAGFVYAPSRATQTVEVTASATPLDVAVDYTLTSGALAVSIAGLPTGVTGSLTVSGPNGYSRSLASGATLVGVAPGTYVVTARAVAAAGGASYAPALATQSVEVRASLTPSTITIAYSATNAGPLPDFTIAGLYITQAVQTLAGSVPLVANRDAFLRVFVTASQPVAARPDVRVRFYQGASLVSTLVLAAPRATVPAQVDEGTLASSWNAAIPGALLQPGLRIVADVDPENRTAESDETNNAFPASANPAALDVRVVPPFSIRFVPIAQTASGLTGNVTSANVAQFLDFARRVLPIQQVNVEVRAPYTTSTPALAADDANGAWTQLLSEMSLLRTADASRSYYYGVVKVAYASGTAGYGYVPGHAAIGWDYLPSGASIAAHEIGHNLSRQHAPCGGASNPDPAFPYAVGRAGVWGYDVASGIPRAPTVSDLMGYCGFTWISDYNYRAILTYRETAPDASVIPSLGGLGAAGATGVQRALLVWGRIAGSRLVLEPAFAVSTRPSLPSRSGPYRIEGLDTRGRTLFSYAFEGEEPADAPTRGTRHFAFAIPTDASVERALATLRLSGNGHSATLAAAGTPTGASAAAPPTARAFRSAADRARVEWGDARVRMALVRDSRTGEVLGLVRSPSATIETRSAELDLVLSDGVRSVTRRVVAR